MAKEYLQKLSALILRLDIEKEVDCRIEVKHLFTGAALYVNKVICASWSPVGLAFKLPEKEVASLISSGKAKFWLEPQVELAADYGLGAIRINAARKIIEEHVDDIRSAWAKHFRG